MLYLLSNFATGQRTTRYPASRVEKIIMESVLGGNIKPLPHWAEDSDSWRNTHNILISTACIYYQINN